MEKQILKQLKAQYKHVVVEYVKQFEKKHDLVFEYWLGDQKIGTIAKFGKYYFEFNIIRFDLESDQPKGKIKKWHDLVDANLEEMDYESYCLYNLKN